MDCVRKYQLMLSAVFGIACIVYLIAIFVLDIGTEVITGRFENANDVFNGNILHLEYPPFALVFMLIPRIFTSVALWFKVGFVIEMFAFFVIGLLLICKMAEKLGADQKKAMLGYTILMLLMLQFVTDRFDIIPAVLTLASVYCYITKRYVWAFMFLSLATMTKLYPAILFPIFIIPFLTDRDWKNVIKGTAVFAITALVVVIPVMLSDPDMLSYFTGYHMDRPLHIESVMGSLIYPLSMIGLTEMQIVFSFGSDNLAGPWPDTVAPLLTPLMLISILMTYALYAFMLRKMKMEKKDDEHSRLFLFGGAILVSIMLFILVGKVFSSQFLIWIIPPVMFLLMLMDDRRLKCIIFLLSAIVLVITQVQFAYNVGYLGGGYNINDLGMMMILLRNIAAIALLYFSVKAIRDRLVPKETQHSAC
ncbi:MAG: DUF2029 domain-containing protein [Methanomassiliicoccaceae archaeon]|nr:DUF2029 domain-containing protein [Methanomassiliicoccaceae archaeon]